MKTEKQIIEDFQKKVADGTWLQMTKEEIDEVIKAMGLEHETLHNPSTKELPKHAYCSERGAGDDYPVIPQ